MKPSVAASTSSAPTYNATLALTFANAVEAAYSFYDDNGKTPISVPGYTIGPSIYVWELTTKTFFGYVATGTPPNSGIPQHNVVVFRGTRTKEEAAYDLNWTPVAGTLGGQSIGNVAKGQYDFYTGATFVENSLSKSMLNAVAWFQDTTLPIYVCGHSLGGGVATLASLDIVLNNAYTGASPIMYTYGGLHVGDQTFVTAFTTAVAAAFRVTNTADFVPQLTGLAADNTSYIHVGEQWWFTAYNQYLWQNHELTNSYLTALTSYPSQVVNTPPPNFPTSAQQKAR
ncbi:lipase family protein [Hyalangium sp.]|uniref:lipase family protein n=1 Tax=Hyalangium sp. TaxID=2028555 RepID=UPI002D3FF283|nr:lipase family protein [Hyalangium sp.]HYH99346.1 lipase family protein [Hyalangium sp.]